MRKFFVCMLVFLSILGFTQTMFAFSGQILENITINTPLNDDYYGLGGKVYVDQKILGDATIVGGEIYINKEIKEDANLAGGLILVDAPIRDDARILGGEITIDNNIDGDLIIIGGEILIKKGGQISGYIQVYISLKGQEIDTKMSVVSVEGLEKWMEDKWMEDKWN